MLSEIGSARASIAASYLALWRKADATPIDAEAPPSPPLVERGPHAATPGPPPSGSCETEGR